MFDNQIRIPVFWKLARGNGRLARLQPNPSPYAIRWNRYPEQKPLLREYDWAAAKVEESGVTAIGIQRCSKSGLGTDGGDNNGVRTFAV